MRKTFPMAHKSKKSALPKPRNGEAHALFARAGNAGCAIAVDTRPKSVPNKRKVQSAKRVKIDTRAYA
jgi:hypothetical protein